MHDPLPRDFAYIAWICLALQLLGLLCLTLLGDQFLSKVHEPYLFGMLLLLPFILLGVFGQLLSIERQTGIVASEVPTEWIRWFAWPMLIVAFGVLSVLALTGWFVTASWLMATESISTPVFVKSVESSNSTSQQICRQHITLEARGSEKRLCLDRMKIAGSIVVGQTVNVVRRESIMGVHIQYFWRINPANSR